MDVKLFKDCAKDILKRLTGQNSDMELAALVPLLRSAGAGALGAGVGLIHGIDQSAANFYEHVGISLVTSAEYGAVAAGAIWVLQAAHTFCSYDLPCRRQQSAARHNGTSPAP